MDSTDHSILQHFKKTDDAMRYDLKNLTSLEWYDKDNIRQLEKLGIQVIQANYRSEKYMQDLTRLINEHIDSCSGLFYDWINWDYIRDLFYVPKYNKPNVMKDEFTKYMANIEYYPFQQYIYWTQGNHGGILSSDHKFLKLLYEMNGDVFSDYTKYRDADDDTLIGENPLELTHKLYEESRVTATKKEMENFCNRYVRTLKLKVVDGKFVIEIQK